MSGVQGFSNQKKIGLSQFISVVPIGSNRNGSPTPQLYLSELVANPIAITDVVVSDDQKKVYLEITAHGARLNDVLRFTSGNLISWEFEVCEVVDANTLAIWNVGEDNDGDTVIPLVGEEAKTYKWVTATSSADGALTVSPGPVKFVDGVEKTVTPADPLPVTNNLTVKDWNYIDMTTDPIGSAYVELSTVASDIKRVQIFWPSGEPLIVAVGPSLAENNVAVCFPGGGEFDLALQAGDRVAVQTLGPTVNSGYVLVNFLG